MASRKKHLAHPVSFLIDGQHLSSTHQVANSSTAKEESLGIPSLEKDLRYRQLQSHLGLTRLYVLEHPAGVLTRGAFLG
jgi:hypothetical protein